MASEDARSAQVEAYHKALLAAAEAQRIAERDARLAAEKAQRAYDRDLAILEEFRGEVSYVVIIVVQRVSRLDCPNRVFNYDPLFFSFFLRRRMYVIFRILFVFLYNSNVIFFVAMNV